MRLNKKLIATAGTLAVAGGLTAAAAGSAYAPPAPKIDASTHTVTCNDILGKIKFGIPLTLGGTTANTVTIAIKSGDCVDTSNGAWDTSLNPTGTTLKSYAAKGVLGSTTNDCQGLQGLSTGTSGSVFGKFATMPATGKLLDATNTLGVTQTYGGTFNDGGTSVGTGTSDVLSWGSQYGFFHIGPAVGATLATTAPTVSGAYSDGGDGTNFTFNGTTAQSSGSLAVACFTTGIKGIQFGIGGFSS